MTKTEANNRCMMAAYDLSKLVSKIADIRDSLKFTADEMKWNDMLLMDYDDALVKLAKVMAGTTLWATEEMFRKQQIKDYRDEADALEQCE